MHAEVSWLHKVPHAIIYICRYTLGGFYLARYSDSPVGKFDEVR